MPQATEDEQRRRNLITDQLAYMVDELGALSAVLKTFPDELLEAQPFEGEPSVRDLFYQLSVHESAIRIPNLERFIAAETGKPTLISDVDEARTEDGQNQATADVLGEVAAARTGLLELVRSADDSVWDRTARLAGEAVTMTDYLFAVVQEDVEVLRAVAQRIHESRPVGSPGFTAR
ncbi:MAG: hypothetical protein KJO98_10615 [Rhodothermia bacterium]|nr:hypothetical protein [Rhodothermia bacterium]